MADTTVVKQEKESKTGAPERIRGGVSYTPRVDIVETPEELTLFADMPGIAPNDLDVRFENGELILDGKCSPRDGERQFLLNEYGVGDFFRAFSIGESIDSTRISAALKNGVLTVHLPKTERVKPKRISVKAE